MTPAQLSELAAAAAAILAIVALIGLAVVLHRLRRLQRQQHVILGSLGERDIVRHVVSLDEKVGHLRTAVEDLGLTSRDHDHRIDACLSRMGVVRFDAYDDLGGRQSTAIALMDAKEDGVVLTTVISRDFARMYVKLLRDGQPDIPLAPEETEAVDQARSRAPFTVRPRMDEAKRAEEAPEPVSAETVLAEEQDVARDLDRENRRRERQGLPLLSELPPSPSSQGWQALEIPTDDTASGDGAAVEADDPVQPSREDAS